MPRLADARRHRPDSTSGPVPGRPVYLLAGTFDVSTTPADARTVADRFPNARTMIVRFGDHSTTLLGPGPTGDCARAELSRFLRLPGGGPGRCSVETYRAIGSFPPTAAALPAPDDQRDIAVGFTTATDALVRRDPFARLPAPQLPGLRGDAVVFDDAGSAISLATCATSPTAR